MSQAMELSATGNDRIKPGGNLSPFDLMIEEIDNLYAEAKNWADGSAIENDEQLAAVDMLDKALLRAGQDADKLRVEEKRPLDELIDAIQARFNPYIQKGKGKVDMARAALNVPRTAYKTKIAAEKAAAAAQARAEFEEQRRVAREAMQASSGNLGAREQAEQQVTAAKAAEKIMKRTEKAATTGLGLRTTWTARLTDRSAAIKHYWAKDPEAFERLVLDMAMTEVRAGIRSIPGFDIQEVKVAN